MILALFVAIPLVCAIAAWAVGRSAGPAHGGRSGLASRIATLVGSLACLVLAASLWLGGALPVRLDQAWIAPIGASFSLSSTGSPCPSSPSPACWARWR